MYFFKNSKKSNFLKKMYFLKIQKNQENYFTKWKGKKCLSGVTLKLKIFEKSGESEKIGSL